MAIRGFITNLSLYNEGKLIGDWIEFPIYEDELEEVFEKIGVGEEYEEYFFSDWDCDDWWYDFGEHVDIDYVNDIAERIERFTENEFKVLEILLDEHTSYLEEALRIIENDIYRFSCQRLDWFIDDLLHEGYFGDIPQKWIDFIDCRKLADEKLDWYYETTKGTLIVEE